ncbi:MAG: hypothetical protein C5B60_00170 [Chloroflexi bacterium]|nr:MAG: hypothetical protein C5B60_00170 [Chloroflexota bacterium]
MRVSDRLARLVTRTINEQHRIHGHVTRKGVTDRVVTQISRSGGPSAFGISQADLLLALRLYVGTEVLHQFKAPLPENTYGRALKSAPAILVQLMHGLPNCIAIEEGADANWVRSLDATSEQWQQHADLKRHKAEQTLAAVDKPQDVARYLAEYGFRCLADLLNGGTTT